MNTLLQDLRIALRNLRRMPPFTWPTVIVLALGLGATSAVVAALRTALFTPPPYHEPQRIHALWWTDREGRGSESPSSWPQFQELQARLKGAAVEGLNAVEMNLSGGGDPELVKVGQATPGLFSRVFQLRPVLGSLHWDPENPAGVVLTEGLWTRRFGRDPAILGRTLTFNGTGHPVLGVLPDAARISGAQAFIPLTPTPNQIGSRYNRFLPLYLRLAPGVGESQFKAELEALSQAMGAEHPGAQEATSRLASLSISERQRNHYRSLATVLGWATGLLILITLVNLANAMVARAAAGAQETALRLALGASRPMALRPRWMEAFLLSAGGLLLGLGVAQLTLALLRPMVERDLQAVRPMTMDLSLFGGMGLAALLVALSMGGLPGTLLSRLRLGSMLGTGQKGLVQGASRRLRTAMAVAQVSLALTLLASFASLGALLLRLTRTPLGLNTQGVAVFTCDTSSATPEQEKAAHARAMALLDRLKSLPGARQAGSIALLPIEDYGWNFSPEIRERPRRDDEWVEMRTASPGLFDAFGIRLLSGRDYTTADMASGEPIAIISQSMARTFWSGRDPLGQEFRFDGQWIRVVGVVSDVRNAGPASDAHQMAAYFPSPTGMLTTTFVVRFDDPRFLNLEALRAAARDTAPQWPIKGLRRMEDVVSGSLSDTRAMVQLLGFAGALSLILSLAGLYNLLSYLVAQRAPEFGLRASLGATPGRILALVLKSGLWIGVLGLATGLLGSLAAGRFMAAFFADATPLRLPSLLSAGGALLLGTLLASLIPALRAARVQPAEALRSE